MDPRVIEIRRKGGEDVIQAQASSGLSKKDGCAKHGVKRYQFFSITYVYESESYGDKEKKQPRSRRKLIGKLDEATGEVIPTGKPGRQKQSDALETEQVLKLKEILQEKDKEIAELKSEIAAFRKERAELKDSLKKLYQSLSGSGKGNRGQGGCPSNISTPLYAHFGQTVPRFRISGVKDLHERCRILFPINQLVYQTGYGIAFVKPLPLQAVLSGLTNTIPCQKL